MTPVTAAVHPLAQARANASDSNSSAAGEAATITANDFLTLLVTEMKNQDPTAQTDPNEYINQLVQVNSLQQLIQINEELSSALEGGSNGGTGSGHAVRALQPAVSAAAGHANTASQVLEPRSATLLPGLHNIHATSGNLSIPTPIPAAQRVAQALSGRT